MVRHLNVIEVKWCSRLPKSSCWSRERPPCFTPIQPNQARQRRARHPASHSLPTTKSLTFQYDPAGEYIKTWLPQLEKVSTAFIQSPWRLSPQDRQRCISGAYPETPVIEQSHWKPHYVRRGANKTSGNPNERVRNPGPQGGNSNERVKNPGPQGGRGGSNAGRGGRGAASASRGRGGGRQEPTLV